MIEFVTTGIILGLSAGLSPGPLLTLVLTETLQHNIGAGIRVAFSPLLTDLPIILLSIFILSRVSGSDMVLGIISLAGGCFVFHMGVEAMKARGFAGEPGDVKERSLMKGVLVNALSPHPYLFWIAVGGPILSGSLEKGIHVLAGFLVSFYVSLVGAKISLAVLTGRSSSLLTPGRYRSVMIFLGICLCLLSMVLVYDGAGLLGVLDFLK